MLKYKNKSTFVERYSRPDRVINANAPEFIFVAALCRGDVEGAANVFYEKKLFGADPVVDAPHGRFEGKNAIGKFAGSWLESFKAADAFVIPVTQTIAGGRSATEMVVHFNQDGAYLRIPMAVVSELRGSGKADEIHIYFNYSYTSGFSAYRPPIYQPSFNLNAEYNLLASAFSEYYQALNGQDVDRMLAVFDDGLVYGGYVNEDVMPILSGTSLLRAEYTRVLARIPSVETVRLESIIDDGVTAVMEWTLVVTDHGREKFGRVSQAGIAAYERGPSGKLISVRICDNLDCEDDIDAALRAAALKRDAEYQFSAKLPIPEKRTTADETSGVLNLSLFQ